MSLKVITPADAESRAAALVPEGFFTVMNALIVKNFCAGRSEFDERTLERELGKSNINLVELHTNWINRVEIEYSNVGWSVRIEPIKLTGEKKYHRFHFSKK